MSDYGVKPSGFVRKPLPQILAEMQTGMVELFGPEVIQTAQSPLGQINGLMADLAAQCWEMAEDVYQSYDPDQAEGLRLDILGKLRLVARAEEELDQPYRQAITNADRARIDIQDLVRAVANVDGVTYSHVFINDSDSTDGNGLAAHSVAVAVLGGADGDIALTVRDYVVPGIGTSGNTPVDTNADGYCRTIYLSRPTPIPVELIVEVDRNVDKLGCPPPALTAIAEGLYADLIGDRRPINGEDVTTFLIRSAIECRYPNVEVVSVSGSRLDDTGSSIPISIAFNEIASFSLDDITILNA